MKEERSERVERYLLGEMAPGEKLAFEEQMEREQDLREEVLFQKNLHEAIREEDIVNLRTTLKVIMNGKSRRMMNSVLISSIAAVFLLFIIIASVMHLQQRKESKIFDYYYERYPAVQNLRSSESNELNSMAYDAFTEYEQNNFEKASNIFSYVLKKDSTNYQVLFYYALTEIETKRFDHAEELFGLLIKNNNHMFWEQSYWYLALVYYRKGDDAECKKLLDRIVEEKMWNHDKAKEILKDLS